MTEDDDLTDEPAADAEHVEPILDVGDPVAVRKRAKKLKFDRREAVDFWRTVFASPVGRREMWGILAACHFNDTKFQCGPNGFPQSEATWYALGEQSIGRRLSDSWALLDRDGYFRMLDEFDPRFAKPAGES